MSDTRRSGRRAGSNRQSQQSTAIGPNVSFEHAKDKDASPKVTPAQPSSPKSPEKTWTKETSQPTVSEGDGSAKLTWQDVEQLIRQNLGQKPIDQQLQQFIEQAKEKLQDEIPQEIVQYIESWHQQLSESQKDIETHFGEAERLANQLRKGKSAYYEQEKVQCVAKYLLVVTRIRQIIGTWCEEFSIELPSVPQSSPDKVDEPAAPVE